MTELLQQCAALLGQGGILTGPTVRQRQGGWEQGPCLASAILRPTNTAQLAAVLKLCQQAGQTVVTHGGKTGKVDGCLAATQDYVISLERMRHIAVPDRQGRTLTVQAGAILHDVQQAAQRAGLLLPIDLGARGSATIGGNIATNAGGNKVLRYGMMRQQILGLEAVLADGTVISSLDTMLKNNAGYDLKQLFIGSEGTLGIITQAVLKLTNLPCTQHTALATCHSLAQVRELLAHLDRQLQGQLSAFEVMWRSYYQLATTHGSHRNHRPAPLPANAPYYVLIETEGFERKQDAIVFEQALTSAVTGNLLGDAVVAHCDRERNELWAIRENTRAYLAWRPVFSYDISLELAAMEPYINTIQQRVRQRWSAARIAVFGHLADGNLHLAIAVGDDSQATHHALSELLYSELSRYHGSISAEHGIGLTRRDYLHYSRSPAEIALMQTLKRALDPGNILNPNKVIGAPR